MTGIVKLAARVGVEDITLIVELDMDAVEADGGASAAGIETEGMEEKGVFDGILASLDDQGQRLANTDGDYGVVAHIFVEAL